MLTRTVLLPAARDNLYKIMLFFTVQRPEPPTFTNLSDYVRISENGEKLSLENDVSKKLLCWTVCSLEEP